jgi:hypothetical protein
VGLLPRAKRKGYVYQPANGWVTFVAEEGVFEADERIVLMDGTILEPECH